MIFLEYYSYSLVQILKEFSEKINILLEKIVSAIAE